MPAKPILIYKLTPSQIALVDRLADADNGVLLDDMEYREVVVWQELDKLGLVRMDPKRRKLVIVLTDLGRQVRASGYFSKKPVLCLTQPQIAALRFLAGGPRGYNDMPGHMVDVCRRLGLRGLGMRVLRRLERGARLRLGLAHALLDRVRRAPAEVSRHLDPGLLGGGGGGLRFLPLRLEPLHQLVEHP